MPRERERERERESVPLYWSVLWWEGERSSEGELSVASLPQENTHTHTHTHSARGGLVRHTERERERERLVFVGSRDQLMESELCHFDTGVVLLHNIKVNNTDKPLVQLGGRLNQKNVLQVPHFDQHPQICLFFEVNTHWQTKLCNLQENQANCAILEETKNSTMKIWSIYIYIYKHSWSKFSARKTISAKPKTILVSRMMQITDKYFKLFFFTQIYSHRLQCKFHYERKNVTTNLKWFVLRIRRFCIITWFWLISPSKKLQSSSMLSNNPLEY